MKTANMSFEKTWEQLESWGSEGHRRINAQQGAGENQFGVPLGKLRGLAKQLKTNHALALQLWETGNADAMILATMLMAPEEITARDAQHMIKPLTYYKLIDELVYNALARSTCAETLRLRWIDSPQEMVGRAGWNLLTARILRDELNGLNLNAILQQIETEILTAPYRKQEAMNRCLVEIGCRCPSFTQKCLALGERLGRFDTSPIPKGCVSTYAPEWIAAVLKRPK